jgi:hypothetical protein
LRRVYTAGLKTIARDINNVSSNTRKLNTGDRRSRSPTTASTRFPTKAALG